MGAGLPLMRTIRPTTMSSITWSTSARSGYPTQSPKIRIVDDLDEIRERLHKDLPDVRLCRFCRKPFEKDDAEGMFEHLKGLSRQSRLVAPHRCVDDLQHIDPTGPKVERSYRSYLRTTFQFKDPQFRESFERALNSGYLSKGPYLGPYQPTGRAGRPGKYFPRSWGLCGRRLPSSPSWREETYLHQEEAIRRVVSGRNVLVASGTGSGKTECYLYPILCHLYSEYLCGGLGDGVRALVLYPMNALANDQRDRLASPGRGGADEGISDVLGRARSPLLFHIRPIHRETPENERDTCRGGTRDPNDGRAESCGPGSRCGRDLPTSS